VNKLRAGAVLPIVFSLNGYQGHHVLAPHYPRSVSMTCGSHADLDGGQRAHAAGHKGLHYVPTYDVYVFLWKTKSHWDNSCRQFVLKLSDGSYHRADARFPGNPARPPLTSR
jgi:hypothetical protein